MYTLNTPDDQHAMLEQIGVASVAALFDQVPEAVRLTRPLNVPPALSEMELTQHVQALAAANLSADRAVCFLGGGSYDHFIPAVVDAVAGRSEFYTAYTPYQAEASQGSLQAFFEYQTLDLPADRHGRGQRQPVRGRQRRGRGGHHGHERHPKRQQGPHPGERPSGIPAGAGHLPAQPRRSVATLADAGRVPRPGRSERGRGRRHGLRGGPASQFLRLSGRAEALADIAHAAGRCSSSASIRSAWAC